MYFGNALCLLVLVAVTASEPLPGNCPDIPAVLNFNSTAFSGVWFDQVHSKRQTGLKLKCDIVQFISSTPNKFNFNSFSYSSATKQIISVSGTAEVVSSSGKLLTNIPSRNLNGEVRVISTDYTTFAVLVACANNPGGTHSIRALVLTREKHPTTTLRSAAVKVLENNNIAKKDLSETRQHNCHEYDLKGKDLSNSLSHVTSMGSLLSVFDTSATQSPTVSTTTSNYRITTRGGLATQAQKIWSSITG